MVLVHHVIPDRRRSVYIATLGCKLNQYESEAILGQFRAVGYQVAEDAESAAVCIVNTCSVTGIADRKSRSLLRSLHRRNPAAALIAVGCTAEKSAADLSAIDGVRAVLGTREKEHLFDFLPTDMDVQDVAVHVGEAHATTVFAEGQSVAGLLGRTRCFLKIQDGCSQKCTYCVIPQLRGQGRSLPVHHVVDRIRKLYAAGIAEVVLTGVALGTYGTDLGMPDGLTDLLSVLTKESDLPRIRLGSVEPWAVTDRLLEVMADSDRICPHLHLPLQSANDVILHRMNRRYTVARIHRIFEQAFTLRNDWGFGSDIIVGFPGESRNHFIDTQHFVAESPLSYLHVFPFSMRPGTPAAHLTDTVPDQEKRDRVTELRTLDKTLRHRFREAHIGTHQHVLLENRRNGKWTAGHTANYLDVFLEAGCGRDGTVVEVLITGLHTNGVTGRLTQ
ncbi:tRNA (N(6)-L-threonylcarbamoyladenosine(37)-C(2))-methylthiotransferase MtaB [candidate division KSB1 bacterium]|nr:MAG: tRNA (N(6)-L-threonylcarbamoyladenosine(37)-C(2))-methylthiotransferase MtaB [candidate division KSB1 bacterium]